MSSVIATARPQTLCTTQSEQCRSQPESYDGAGSPNPASVEAQTPDVGPERGSAVMGGGRR